MVNTSTHTAAVENLICNGHISKNLSGHFENKSVYFSSQKKWQHGDMIFPQTPAIFSFASPETLNTLHIGEVKNPDCIIMLIIDLLHINVVVRR